MKRKAAHRRTIEWKKMCIFSTDNKIEIWQGYYYHDNG